MCSVGVVTVRGGEIADRFYSLIHPEPEYYQWFCRRVHGLGPEDTDAAQVFPYVWERIEPLIQGLPLVAHNARFDECCLKAVFRVYRMDYPDYVFFDSRSASPCTRRCRSLRPHRARNPLITIPLSFVPPLPGLLQRTNVNSTPKAFFNSTPKTFQSGCVSPKTTAQQHTLEDRRRVFCAAPAAHLRSRIHFQTMLYDDPSSKRPMRPVDVQLPDSYRAPQLGFTHCCTLNCSAGP